MKKEESTQRSETSTIVLMLAYLCAYGFPVKDYPEKVAALDRFALSDFDIATVLNCTIKQVKEFRKNI